MKKRIIDKICKIILFVIIFTLGINITEIYSLEDTATVGYGLKATYNSSTKEVIVNENHSNQNVFEYYLEPEVFNRFCQERDVKIITFNCTRPYVPQARGLFKNLSQLETINNLSRLDIYNNDYSYLFAGCSALKTFDLSDISAYGIANLSHMFDGCTSLTSVNMAGRINGNTNDVSYLFSGCSNLTSINFGQIDTSNVSNFSGMFNGCSSLTSIQTNNFNTFAAVNMSEMFKDCTSLTSLDISSFNTFNLNNTAKMFYNCKSLTNLKLGYIVTSEVTDMNQMFYNCEKLKEINLNDFDTRKSNKYESNVLWMQRIRNFKINKL